MAQRLERASYGCTQQGRANLRWGAGARAAWKIRLLRSTAHCLVVRRRRGRQSDLPVVAINSRKPRHRLYRPLHDTKHNLQRRGFRPGLSLPVSRWYPKQDAEQARCHCILPSWQSEPWEEWLWLKARSPSPYPASRTVRSTPPFVGQNRTTVEHAREIEDRQADPALPVWAD